MGHCSHPPTRPHLPTYRLTFHPQTTHADQSTFDTTTYVDFDMAGAWMSTTGCSATLAGVTTHHYSRAQAAVAFPSGGAELYTLRSGATETMGALQFLRVCDVKTDGYVTMATGPSAGKSVASRLGPSRAEAVDSFTRYFAEMAEPERRGCFLSSS